MSKLKKIISLLLILSFCFTGFAYIAEAKELDITKNYYYDSDGQEKVIKFTVDNLITTTQEEFIDIGDGLYLRTIVNYTLNDEKARIQSITQSTTHEIHTESDPNSTIVFSVEQKATFVYDKDLQLVYFSSGEFSNEKTASFASYTAGYESNGNLSPTKAEHKKTYKIKKNLDNTYTTEVTFYMTCTDYGFIYSGLQK